jgi:hypothetical protein
MPNRFTVRARLILLAAASVFIGVRMGQAQTTDTWIGLDGNFSDDNNWDPYSPLTGGIALIQDTDGLARKIQYDTSADLSGLTLDLSGGSSSDANTLNMAGNMLEVDGPEIIGRRATGSSCNPAERMSSAAPPIPIFISASRRGRTVRMR